MLSTGPLYVKSFYNNGNGIIYKAKIVSVTCANSRAFYLDLVPDSIRKLYFDVLQRFICTNGTPKIITSNYNIKRTQHFPKNYNFLPSDTHTFVYLSGDQK